MIYSTADYLYINDFSIGIGIDFTINDLIFCRDNKHKIITLNAYKKSREDIKVEDLTLRLTELLRLDKALNKNSTKKHELICKDFNISLELA